ncbi:thiamine-monophosphate kinase [Paeniglutamicibacter sulfureus]|uniref:Thiamine-monophosphate kinase n=2 Tax=Paeniglutamicibacter sulfureus TaxID=43666 RepID=A0ABU2BP12_9MICC|nr:thiamine-monophosphate kinase [Paeniglutamicibacter sulfureus]
MPAADLMTVGNLGESGLLKRILPRLQGAPALLGPGDDAALIAAPGGKFVITVDTLVENQDFRLSWPSGFRSSGFDVGWKSAAQNLSDVNAMGAIATSAVISLTLPHSTPISWVEDLADGFSSAVRELGACECAIGGGDLGRGSELSITAAVTGALATDRAVLRSGARPGDVVAVGGVLGVAAAGLALMDSSVSHVEWTEDEKVLVLGQRRPTPPLAAGPDAARAGASAMMDLSDGLLKDGRRMAIASGVAIDFDTRSLEADALRLSRAAARLGREAMDWVLGGGEDHGLLATFPKVEDLPDGFRAVGMVRKSTGGEPGGEVLLDGRRADSAKGFDHFEG